MILDNVSFIRQPSAINTSLPILTVFLCFLAYPKSATAHPVANILPISGGLKFNCILGGNTYCISLLIRRILYPTSYGWCISNRWWFTVFVALWKVARCYYVCHIDIRKNKHIFLIFTWIWFSWYGGMLDLKAGIMLQIVILFFFYFLVYNGFIWHCNKLGEELFGDHKSKYRER